MTNEAKYKAFESLLSITIPIPTMAEYNAGIYSSRGPGGGKIDTRMNQFELKSIREAAALLDMTPSSFLKLCGTNAAKQILEHYNAYQQHHGGG